MNEEESKQFRNDFIDLLNKYNISVVEVVEKRFETINPHDNIVFISKDGRIEMRFPSLILVRDFKKI